MKYKVSELEGPVLDVAYILAAFPEFSKDHVAIRDGKCVIYDNPCGFPGPCYGWWTCEASKLEGDVVSAFVKWSGVKWGDKPAGPDLVMALRRIVRKKFGENFYMS